MKTEMPGLGFTLPVPLRPYDPRTFDPRAETQKFQKHTRELFLEQGELQMTAVFAAQKEPRWVFADPRPGPYTLYVLMAATANEAGKEAFTRMLTRLLEDLDACYLALAIETWAVVEPSPRGVVDEVLAYRKVHGTMKGHPAVGEAITVMEETTNSAALYMARIHRAGTERTPRLGCFTEFPGQGEGRFCNLLRPLHATVSA